MYIAPNGPITVVTNLQITYPVLTFIVSMNLVLKLLIVLESFVTMNSYYYLIGIFATANAVYFKRSRL